ncbi:TPA: hypothetical protein KQB57_002792 [Clostridioides difficile]|uniref:Uncharacterized protein n=1 Tax=Clostridioides difficile ATCC 9689 = DSM 1296 TaxID=1121308 RepID=A0ACA7UNZ6_CLODI|nr:hypothetical protein [Clostridioides difficile]YP_009221728.1 putative phage-related DNA binding protein [Clostridium phage phiCD211]AKP44804.1 hypothetical protein CDIF1296T_phi130 [Peptoclostridium phage phiCDIF1296T]MDC0804581.1 hypothetical protein [Clostridium paraputrificum]CCL67184.1 putative phage-related DNA binding protein [Clostridioides difficile E7]ARC16954.1 hypothetical protein A6J95_19525 [Clostridioides difficile]AVI14415.1 hypothetical protein C4J70_19520 [Clostridioides 
MFVNWKIEMIKNNITVKEIANILNKDEELVKSIIDGQQELSIIDGVKIREIFFPKLSLDYLYLE